jgi:hypothetical protein
LLNENLKGDGFFYLLASACGIGTGWADVVIDDLLFTALLVLSSCILPGMLRPRWPSRWVLTVGIIIPLTELAAYLIRTVKRSRGTDLWIVSRVSAGDCWSLWGIGDAQGRGQSAAGKVEFPRDVVSFAPSGLAPNSDCLPTGCAMGCILAPLRG